MRGRGNGVMASNVVAAVQKIHESFDGWAGSVEVDEHVSSDEEVAPSGDHRVVPFVECVRSESLYEVQP